ncbi:MAG: thiamine pyrophosphate-dependent dehydrogenase E1 component subunit alpha [Actinomycetales bacterium]|nr:thiamine pyrophosphate-dependent dehydrogenase E1 component subunit alpha [Actinomycetales bacterium]
MNADSVGSGPGRPVPSMLGMQDTPSTVGVLPDLPAAGVTDAARADLGAIELTEVDLRAVGLGRVDLTGLDLLGMYRDMTLVRRLDLEATALQRQGELGLWAPSLGQEAAQVGSGYAMSAGDFAFPTYREHGVCLSRGVTPLEILSLYRGISNGGWNPVQRRVALPIIVIANQVLHAVGYAMGIALDKASGSPTEDAVIGYFGDGASSEGDVHEACVFAASFRAPVVLFCTNNQWAISHPVARQISAPLVERVAGYGMPSVRVDGNDVLASYAVTKAALESARSGAGPVFIEAMTYRMGAHTTSDDPSRYRPQGELESWRAKDPIARLKAYLVASGRAEPAFFVNVDQQAEALAEQVRRGVRGMVTPDPATMFDHVYAEDHPLIEQQRQWVAKNSGSVG